MENLRTDFEMTITAANMITGGSESGGNGGGYNVGEIGPDNALPVDSTP